jgi:hypothetical protein
MLLELENFANVWLEVQAYLDFASDESRQQVDFPLVLILNLVHLYPHSTDLVTRPLRFD